MSNFSSGVKTGWSRRWKHWHCRKLLSFRVLRWKCTGITRMQNCSCRWIRCGPWDGNGRQHQVVELANDSSGIVELMVLDNGNFRSRDDNKILLPADNDSWIVHLIVNLHIWSCRRLNLKRKPCFWSDDDLRLLQNEITNGAGYRYDITSCEFYSS